MAKETLTQNSLAPEPFSAARAVLDGISSDGGAYTDGDFSALAMLLIDATLRGDEVGLKAVQEWLRWEYSEGLLKSEDESDHMARCGRLLGLADVSHWAIERVLPLAALSRLERGGYTARFLRELVATPGLSNQELAERLAVDETEVSRVGRRLLEDGMAVRRRVGRRNYWEISPKGRRSLQLLQGGRAGEVHVPLEASSVDSISGSSSVPDAPEPQTVSSSANPVLDAAGGALMELLANDGIEPDRLRRQVAAVADVAIDVADHALDQLETTHFVTRSPSSNILTLNRDRAAAVGVNITATQVLAVVVGPRGNPLGSVFEHSLSATDVESVVSAVANVTRDVLAARPEPRDEVLGLGVALAGHVDGRAGRVVLSTELRDGDQLWRDVALARRLQDATRLPVVVENDANALTIRELLYGSGSFMADFAAVLLSAEGLGCGLVSEGVPIHGHEGIAGELGHLVVDPNGDECRCGNRGCLETIVSLAGMRRAYMRHGGSNSADPESLLQYVPEDDVLADVLASTGTALGRGVSHLLNLVNPARVVVFSPRALVQEDSMAAQIFQQAVRSAATQYSFSYAHRSDLHFRETENSSISVGAASLVLNRLVGRHNLVHGTSRPLMERGAEADSVRAAMFERAMEHRMATA